MKKLAFLFLLIISINLYAQKETVKFGKLDDEDLKIESCDFYPEAHSMILKEYGNLKFAFFNNEGTFKYQMTVLVRKKIFNKVDKDAGSIKIRYYEPLTGSSKEEISAIKGFTYNVVNDKVKKVKLDKSGKFSTRVNDYMKEFAITMPDVQEGSIIEYSYTITSNLLSTLKTWHFQSDIPVKYSELRVTLPEFYNYQMSNVGAVAPIEVEEKFKNEEFQYTYKVSDGSTKRKTQFGKIPSRSIYKRLIARDVPPIPDEPFMNNKKDVPNRVEFQLISIKMPQSPVKSIAENYESFNKLLVQRSDFGGRLNKGNFAKNYISTLEGKSELEQATLICSWLQNYFSWNEYTGITSENAGRPVFNDGKGSVSDLNLTLIAALNEAGIETYPVILSTRGNGMPHPIYPSFNDFNYVVALVKVNGAYYFADATQKLPLGMLPTRCLNGKGWLVSKDGGSWIELKQGIGYVSNAIIYTLIDEKKLENSVVLQYVGYAASGTGGFINKNGEQAYQERLAGDYPEWEFEGFNIEKNSIPEGVQYKYKLVKEREEEDILYIQPLLAGMDTENPFKREERYSPIDFPYSYNKKAINVISIPEGYDVELPESGIFALPDNAGRFLYSVTQTGKVINITSELKLSKTDFTPAEYPALKQFYQMMTDKVNSVIVLKKI